MPGQMRKAEGTHDQRLPGRRELGLSEKVKGHRSFETSELWGQRGVNDLQRWARAGGLEMEGPNFIPENSWKH